MLCLVGLKQSNHFLVEIRMVKAREVNRVDGDGSWWLCNRETGYDFFKSFRRKAVAFLELIYKAISAKAGSVFDDAFGKDSTDARQ